MKKVVNKIFIAILIFIIFILIQNISDAVSSNYYEIDSEEKMISVIEPETTIETFKTKIASENELKVYKDKECTQEVTTGLIGTGMYIKSGENIYKTSVVGDFDGDGKATQVELSKIIKHIVGLEGAELEGINYKSADLTLDGKVDQRDITKYIKYIVFGELDLGKTDTVAPTIELEVIDKTSNEIKVEASVTDRESGMGENPTFTFYVKETGQNDSEYRQVQSGTNPILELTQLEQNKSYDIKVETTDNAGNKGEEVISVKTEKIPDGTETGAIIFGTPVWSNGKAQVTISTNTDYIIEYQVNGTTGTWTKATAGGQDITVTELNHNDIIYARLTDGTSSGDYATLTIADTVNPNVNLSIEAENKTLTATASATDNESGIDANATYTFYIKEAGADDSTYEQKQNTTSKTLTVGDLTVGKSYTIKVEVVDRAGNKGIAEKSIEIPDDVEPTVEVNVTEKTSDSVTIEAIATDEGIDSDELEYKFYIKEAGQDDSEYVEKPSDGGNTCTIDGLDQDKEYIIKVEVIDPSGNVREETITVTTEKIPDGTETGGITFGTPVWSNGKAQVTISTNTDYIIEYQVNGTTGTWTKATAGGQDITVTGLKHNDIIFARLTDGKSSGNYATLTVADTIQPEEFSIAVTNILETKITVSGSTVDNQTGLKNYTYIAETSSGTQIKAENITETSYELTGLESGTEYTVYMLAYDNAGNVRKSDVMTVLTLITITNIDTSETDPESAMPEGATLIEGDATKGIVIKDSAENEWTWIEVPKSITASATTDTEIESALSTYSDDYKDYVGNKDEWYAMDGTTLVTGSTTGLTSTQKRLSNGCGLTYDEYNTAKSKMLQSIKTNGGFWISRYEIGDSTSTASSTTRTADSGVKGTPVSQADQIPYNYVTCTQAQGVVEKLETDSNKTVTLLFGIQWNLACKFFELKGDWDLTTNTALYYICEEGSSWGNHRDSNLNITSENAKEWTFSLEAWASASDTKPADTPIILTTGASEEAKVMNVYDFAGNMSEFVLQKYWSSSTPCITRGGNYLNESSLSGGTDKAWGRNYDATSDAAGFRATFY